MKRSEAYMSRADWVERYATIEKQYEASLAQHVKLDPGGRESVRRLEEFRWRLKEPGPFCEPNIRVPSDPEFAARAFVAFCAGLPDE